MRVLPGIPTIRVFEALACGIPLVCSPWDDAEGLFTPGKDYLVARDGEEMKRHLRMLLDDPAAARQLADHGRRTLLARHTCAHRVQELLTIHAQLAAESRPRRVRQRLPGYVPAGRERGKGSQESPATKDAPARRTHA